MAVSVEESTISGVGSASPALARSDGGTVDLDRLAQPVDPERPAGPSLRYEGTYDAVAAARQADDPSLPQGVWQTELKQADWRGVVTLCREALESCTKDLQLGVWLVEALVHRDGFAGAGEGLTVLSILVETFWDDLHPEIDEDGLESRLAPLAWMAARLPLALRRVPLTRPSGFEARGYTLGDWLEATFVEQRARRAGGATETEEGAAEPERPTRVEIQKALDAMPGERRSAVIGELDAARGALERLAAALESRCADDAPSLSPLRRELEAAERLVVGRTPRVSPPPARPPADDTSAPGQPAAPAATGEARHAAPPSAGRILGREQAYALLDEFADYLLKIEPHSPAPYLVKRAVSWSRLSLADLLAEFIRQDGNLERLLYLLGIDENAMR
jgi:type VI secretion system protein ImpA